MLTIQELLTEVADSIPVPNDSGDSHPMIYERHEWGWEKAIKGVANVDIYDLLDEYGRTHPARFKPLEMPLAYVAVTSGWGAPLNDEGDIEGIPSEHPQRRRLSLFYVSSVSGDIASRLYFHDKGEVILDDGSATGSLAEALDRVSAYLWGARFLNALSNRALQDAKEESELKAALGRLVRVRMLFDDEPELTRFESN